MSELEKKKKLKEERKLKAEADRLKKEKENPSYHWNVVKNWSNDKIFNPEYKLALEFCYISQQGEGAAEDLKRVLNTIAEREKIPEIYRPAQYIWKYAFNQKYTRMTIAFADPYILLCVKKFIGTYHNDLMACNFSIKGSMDPVMEDAPDSYMDMIKEWEPFNPSRPDANRLTEAKDFNQIKKVTKSSGSKN